MLCLYSFIYRAEIRLLPENFYSDGISRWDLRFKKIKHNQARRLINKHKCFAFRHFFKPELGYIVFSGAPSIIRDDKSGLIEVIYPTGITRLTKPAKCTLLTDLVRDLLR